MKRRQLERVTIVGSMSAALKPNDTGLGLSSSDVGMAGAMYVAGACIGALFFGQLTDRFGRKKLFLITLGVPIAAWAGILMADVALRRRDYDERALFHRTGRYGDWNWVAIGIMAVASVIGWGLVINLFADAASWNNWQG